MSDFKLSKENYEVMQEELITYFSEELDQDLGNLQARFLIDFIGEKLHSESYKMGVNDAMYELRKNIDRIEEDLDSLTYF